MTDIDKRKLIYYRKIHIYIMNNKLLRTFSIVALIFPMFLGCIKTKSNDSTEKKEEKPLFSLKKASHTNIDFVNTITEDAINNIINYQNYYDGGGVAIADFNKDGLPDVFFTGNMVQNKLYLNKGDLEFEDITSSAGLTETGLGWYTGVNIVDINNDGWLDMYVCKSGQLDPVNRKNVLYINNGDLTFTERASEYGLDHDGYSSQALFLDFDRDGDLDMFLANLGPAENTSFKNDANELRKLSDPYKGDKLFENINGKYVDITKNSGIFDHALGFAHSVGVGDFNNDNWPDIFVCNDYTEYDFYYLNNGDKTFTESGKTSFKHFSNASMGNDVSDFNNDGLLDIVVVDMVAEDNKRLKENMGGMQRNDFEFFLSKGYFYQYMFNMLHMNTGNSTFSDIAHLANISNTDWSWSPLFADFDNDGWKDLYVTNGLKRDARNQDAKYVYFDLLKKANKQGRESLSDEEWEQALNAMPSEKLKNYMYKNVNGLRFEKVIDQWGTGIASFSNGSAYSDLDNDGDIDLVVNNINEEAFVFENQSNKSNNYINFNLVGPKNNTEGIGTKIKIWASGNLQLQERQFNRGFRSSMVGSVHFGLGETTKIDSILVSWPDQSSQIIYDLKANQKLELNYAKANNSYHEPNPKHTFKPAKDILIPPYEHVENKFSDFDREVLLPHTMSALGPFIEVGDVNGDDLEDFFVGGSYGSPGMIYFQTNDGKFQRKSQIPFEQDKDFEDAGSLFFDYDNDGDLDLYVVSGGNEFDTSSEKYQDRLYQNDSYGNFSKTSVLPKINISGSVVRADDFDADGDLDLFVGGRQTPGLYPNPTSSLILLNQGNFFEEKTEDIAPELNDIGMVTSAEWVDYDDDNDMDLILAGEWMPITIMNNDRGILKKSDISGLENTTGWWFSIKTSDLDNDGDQDFIVGNIGLNYKYKASIKNPFEIYSKDFDNNGTNDIVLAYYDQNTLYPLRGKSCSSEQIPTLKEKFPTYKSFATADLVDVYGGPDLSSALNFKAQLFASVYVENKGDGNFEIHELPDYAQLSSINGIAIHDVDKDGLDDLMVAGNMYGSEIETVRNDAGYGMYLKNMGANDFIAFPFPESGLYMDGDVKSLAKIRTSNGYYLLAGTNKDKLQVMEILE